MHAKVQSRLPLVTHGVTLKDAEEIVRLIGGNDLGVARINQREGAACRADVDRLPEAIQHQNLTIQ